MILAWGILWAALVIQLALARCRRNQATQDNTNVVLCWNYDIVFTSIEGYQSNPEFIGSDSYMKIRRHDKGALPGLTHVIRAIKPLPNSTTVEANVYELRDNKLVPSWLKYKNNLCDYVNKEKRPIFDELKKVYKLTCPLYGVYEIENWRPDDGLLPPVLPGPDRMEFGITFSNGATNILKYRVAFLVDRSRSVRGGRGGKARRTQV